ncbi:hypothetical protein EJ110_NYTH25255 [Nymphaea thermarum]|nr:hypothetical protein EJ110_NYTH25255 [Nymphaea thermarum]
MHRKRFDQASSVLAHRLFYMSFTLAVKSEISRSHGDMSEYENVVVGKLKLKGKALDVKSGGIKKKKKKHQQTGTSHNEPSGGHIHT